MDRTDKLINNREPKRMLVMFAVVLLLGAGAWYLLSGVIADAAMEERIRGALSFYSGQRFTDVPDDEHVDRGEALAEGYGISADMSPRLMGGYGELRRRVFLCGLGATAALDLIWLLFALGQLFRVYGGIERVRAQCMKLSDDLTAAPPLIGDDMSCVGRLAESVAVTGKRLGVINSELAAAKGELADFLADLSHQLKTSLAVIRLNSDILAQVGDLPNERRTQLSDELTSNIDGMEELVLAALKLAKLDAGAVAYEMREQPLADTCNEAIIRIAPLLREHGVTATLRAHGEVRLVHDRAWLCEAVENIIKNALDHSECTEILVETEALPSAVKLSVSDNGRGIPQEEIPRLFERFGRASKGRSMTSVGIGLSIARKIAVAHSGDITVYSEEGAGTKFVMTFLL
ncbi:MAG: HAMP domain-containing sensor histidine kinase [Ruminococcus sp.]|nr:HAMP domain-containing sensor histidine kinase [Ruminococcus sp.]